MHSRGDKRRQVDRRAADRRQIWWDRVMLVCMTLALTAVASVFVDYLPWPGGGAGVSELPPELVGTWTTTDSRYADRPLTFESDRITFGLGNGTTQGHIIRDVRMDATDVRTSFEITYSTVDGRLVLEMTLLANGSLRLKNPDNVVWTRSDA